MELSMKGWDYYLLRVWRWIRLSMIIVALLAMLSAILIVAIIFIFPNASCEYSSRTISPKQGNFDAVVDGKCCDCGCVETIKLHRRSGWGLDTKIFVYYPASMGSDKSWTHDPVAVWLSANELEIDVDRVANIDTQLEEAHGVKIKYRIGLVDSQFARSLALEGGKVISFLKARLTDAQDDRIVDAIVGILKDMVTLDTYDVVDDEELMRLVDERVKGMTDPGIKENTEQDLAAMRERASWAQALKRLRGELGK